MFSVANRRRLLLMIGILAFALVCVMCRRTEGFMRRRSRLLSKGKKIENTSDKLTKEDTQIKTKIGDLKRVDKDFEKQIKEKAERQTILDIKDRLTNLESKPNYNPA